MSSLKRFKVLLLIILSFHVILSITFPSTLLLIPITLLLLLYNRSLDIRLEFMEQDFKQKIKELVDAENLTRTYVTKLTDQSKILTKKITTYENSTGKLNRKLHRCIGDRLRMDYERDKKHDSRIGPTDVKGE